MRGGTVRIIGVWLAPLTTQTCGIAATSSGSDLVVDFGAGVEGCTKKATQDRPLSTRIIPTRLSYSPRAKLSKRLHKRLTVGTR